MNVLYEETPPDAILMAVKKQQSAEGHEREVARMKMLVEESTRELMAQQARLASPTGGKMASFFNAISSPKK